MVIGPKHKLFFYNNREIFRSNCEFRVNLKRRVITFRFVYYNEYSWIRDFYRSLCLRVARFIMKRLLKSLSIII